MELAGGIVVALILAALGVPAPIAIGIILLIAINS